MRRVAVALAIVAVLLGAAWLVSLRVVVVDPRPVRCDTAERHCDQIPHAVGRFGEYDVALSGDGCLRGKFASIGSRRKFRVYELESDGGERLHAEGRMRFGAQR